MIRRLSPLILAACAGLLAARFVAPRLGAPSWWPDRERDRSVHYYRDVLQTVRENYVDGTKANYDDLTRAALKGMVGQLDPHSEFLTKDEYAQTEEELSNQFDGVGIQVEQPQDGRILVIATIPGTSAEEAGIRRGDQLVKIDGQALVNPSLDKTIKLIRGDPGTTVKLTMFRTSANRELEFTLKRQHILMHSVRNVGIRPDGIGYLQITQFSEHTGDEFADALVQLEKKNLRALIIDLRNNPGGLLDAAIDVCGEFFDKDELIVFTQGRDAGSRQNFLADGKHPPRKYPIAILVNGGTASAAEIVSGAMRDTRRAVIIGEKTFGKGSVQSVIDLQNGEGLRLTTARYYTPSGVTIHEKGITPHVVLEVSADDEAKISLQQTRTDLTTPAEFKARFEFEPIDDLQKHAAEEVLAGLLAARPGASARK
jgi:carboxyl-terminal processing protease